MVEMIIIIMIMFLIITTMSMMTIVTNLTEQGDIGRSRSESCVRTKALDEGRRGRNLQDYQKFNFKQNCDFSL